MGLVEKNYSKDGPDYTIMRLPSLNGKYCPKQTRRLPHTSKAPTMFY